jgi:hypothetical protein
VVNLKIEYLSLTLFHIYFDTVSKILPPTMKLTRLHKTELLDFFTASTDTSVEIPVFEG